MNSFEIVDFSKIERDVLNTLKICQYKNQYYNMRLHDL